MMSKKEEDAIEIGKLVWSFDEEFKKTFNEYQQRNVNEIKDRVRKLLDDIQITEYEEREHAKEAREQT